MIMSMRHLQRRCHRKKAYDDFDKVNLAGIKQMKEYDAPQLYFYLCTCNKWHLTHKKAKYKVV